MCVCVQLTSLDVGVGQNAEVHGDAFADVDVQVVADVREVERRYCQQGNVVRQLLCLAECSGTSGIALHNVVTVMEDD